MKSNNGSMMLQMAQYLRKTERGEPLIPPGFAVDTLYQEAAEALYRAYEKGGSAAARAAYEQVLKTWRHLADLVSPQFAPIPASELKHLPGVEWWLEGILPKRQLVEIHGVSGIGKTFVTIHISAMIAQRSPVIYVAPEGKSGFRDRVAAWEQAHQRPIGNLKFLFMAVNLLSAEDTTKFIIDIWDEQPALVILDTLARNVVGGDENTARDMGIAIDNCQKIIDALGTTVLLVHHTGKKGREERGSSVIRGGCDVMIEVLGEKGADILTIAPSKIKDGEPFEKFRVRLVKVGPSKVIQSAGRAQEAGANTLKERDVQVLEALALDIFTDSGAPYRRIADNVGFEGGALDKTLSKLVKLEYIRLAKKGDPYFITTSGRDALDSELARMGSEDDFPLRLD